MTDFIIVGQGLAATTLAHRFAQNAISFKLIGNTQLSNCSKVAAGIWNPIVFKRLTKSWLANDLIPELNIFYSQCEHTLNKKLITQRPIIKPFTEEQEKTLWVKKATDDLSAFLDSKIYSEGNSELNHCKIINDYGTVLKSGNLNVWDFIEASAIFFENEYLNETFDYSLLNINENGFSYKSIKAKHIVFCEGYLVKNNPYFKWIPLKPAKGEVLTIRAPDLKFKNKIFNRNGFIMDIVPDEFKVGATYQWDDLDENLTEKATEELKQKLGQLIDCDYTILRQESGVRPSSIDRRPIIGRHPAIPTMFVFNGLGTKGVMLAPFFSKNFVNFYLQKECLNPEVDLKRFYNLYVTQ